ncbi:hypothetical protein CFBP3846_P400082 (plasmid) [Pseudomonas syringae pv. avii]|uniref:Secreted protein n=1 Tax=Pseudomonas syringae pv. avii TaxID=663959 RepID=A0ABY1UG18_PSESX|nr:hypothetical protein CFBP3846_P400082 [Pseudomonas syringae pv. avii]
MERQGRAESHIRIPTRACEALCAAITKHPLRTRSPMRLAWHCLTRADLICGLPTSAHSYATLTVAPKTTNLLQRWK